MHCKENLCRVVLNHNKLYKWSLESSKTMWAPNYRGEKEGKKREDITELMWVFNIRRIL